MKNLLPLVKPEIGICIEHELLQNKKDDIYIKEQLKKIQKENPVISFWIETFSQTTRDKKGAIFCSLMVFKMLRIQAECDRMKSEIKL